MPEITRISRSVPPARWPCFGPWQTVALLGWGTWSRVYRARPTAAPAHGPADYAVKVAQAEGAAEQEWARQLLIREAHLGRKISHPNLTCVLASGLSASPSYLVMPFIQGATVESALSQTGRLAIPRALRIIRQCAAAAAELHRHDWLHGDIKPSNIWLGNDGHAVLLDLGLARRPGEPEERQPRLLAGTPDYLAPEMFSSVLEVGPSADIYSLGGALYRMLTGRPPFVCATGKELVEAHLHQAPPDPRRFQPCVSPALARLMLQMLAKEPDDRPTPEALIRELVELEIATFEQRFVA